MMAHLFRGKILSPTLKSFGLVSRLSPNYFSTKEDETIQKVSKPKFKIFKDEDSPIILDVEEELALQSKKVQTEKIVRQTVLEEEIFERGVTGVFEIEELVSYLKQDSAKDIFVIKVPSDLKYVDYFVVVTGRSRRHILGLAEYVRSIFKKKMDSSDIIPMIEGKDSSEWIAMDLGNIALHVMSKNAREKYDLESLWTLGPQYDIKINQKEVDEVLELVQKHSVNLDDLRPLETS